MIDIYSIGFSQYALYLIAFVCLLLVYVLFRFIRKRMYVVLPILDTLKDDNSTKIRILHVTKTKFDDNIYVVFVDGHKDGNIRVLAEHEFLMLKSRNNGIDINRNRSFYMFATFIILLFVAFIILLLDIFA